MPVNIFTTLDDPLATNLSFAEGINDAGQIVGQFRDASNRLHGYLLSGGSFITLDDPAATNGTGKCSQLADIKRAAASSATAAATCR